MLDFSIPDNQRDPFEQCQPIDIESGQIQSVRQLQPVITEDRKRKVHAFDRIALEGGVLRAQPENVRPCR